jgi:hypothetical protein
MPSSLPHGVKSTHVSHVIVHSRPEHAILAELSKAKPFRAGKFGEGGESVMHGAYPLVRFDVIILPYSRRNAMPFIDDKCVLFGDN